jgi:hypothetical protein
MAAVVFFLVVILYFVPATISMIRGDKNMVSLLIANLFLGWTFIGWVVVLCLACRNLNRAPPVVVVPHPGYHHQPGYPQLPPSYPQSRDDDTIQLNLRSLSSERTAPGRIPEQPPGAGCRHS